jgi:hypothetical protein
MIFYHKYSVTLNSPSGLFNTQIVESTDVTKLAHFLAYYQVYSNDIKADCFPDLWKLELLL